MDIHMCTYPSPLISDQYDYNIYMWMYETQAYLRGLCENMQR